jgi:predicted NBD/HSP70 family sugar kinase
MKIICFDIGGTKILKAVVKISGEKFKFLEIEEEKNPRGEDKIKNIVLTYCQKARKRYWAKKIAFSAAHIVDLEKKMINGGKWCYGTASFDLKFFEKNGFSVRAENDGRCFAAGEYFFGKGKGMKSLCSIALGTNIGGGFIIDGRNFRGSHQSAMEISFLNIFHGSKWYDWDDFSAGNGIERLYKNKVGRKSSSQDIFQKAENKDAEEVIKQAAEFLGMGVANLINILDPGVVVFGGSVSKQKKYIWEAVAIAKKNVMNKKANYKFAISSLGNKANLLGAASLYLK